MSTDRDVYLVKARRISTRSDCVGKATKTGLVGNVHSEERRLQKARRLTRKLAVDKEREIALIYLSVPFKPFKPMVYEVVG